MDDLLERFLSGDSIQRQVISGGSTNGRIRTEYEETSYDEEVVPEPTKEYAKPFVEMLRDEVWKRFENDAPPEKEETTDIYDKYNFLHHLRAAPLPIESHKNEILETVRNNNVVVLRGPTGCGKTTKVPQFILDDYRQRGLYCNIVVAQPRRIAASSNAKRVCRERGWDCGSIVGYQVGSDHRENCSEDTRILFCTTGVLVESLIHSKAHNPLNAYTHIILDEVHERDKDMDFLMIAIYKYINPKIHVILMSATINVEKFARYYQIPQNFEKGMAPVIELGAERNFHVEKVYLDDLEPLTHEERLDTPDISDQMYQMALKLIVFFEKMDRKQAIAAGTDIETYQKNPKPSVLVFLPGIYEIKQMHYRLDEWCSLNDETNIMRIVMHSTANPILNEMAMMESNKNTRKIILATNIAESSITVPDVKYVIDFCLSRTLLVNPTTKFPMLQMVWASRDNCEQRAGRTGRVTNGWCFRLVSRHFYNRKLKQSADAELLTNPLENIILKTKQLDIGSPEEVLALALDKPYLNDIHEAVLRLKEMGAMMTTTKGQVVPRDGDITYIGEIMSRLPIDVKLSKLIALGYCFGVLDECIIIAAALNCSKSFFLRDHIKGVHVYEKRLEFADGSGSDLFALLNAYKTWKRLRGQGVFGDINNERQRKAVRAAERAWAEANFLEITSLRECLEKVKELRIRISRMNLLHSDRSTVSWNKKEKYIVLKVVISGAFYPNYFSRSTKLQRSEEAETFKKIGGRDPSDTVYFSAFNPSYLPHIYIKLIKNILLNNGVISERDFHNITVSNDGVAERVYVSFKKSGKEGDKKEYGVACQPGVVLTDVYKAVKLGKLKGEHSINVLTDRQTALCYARDHGLTYTSEGKVWTKPDSAYEKLCYPRKSDENVKGYITHTENCSRFWFQPTKYLKKVEEIYEELNNSNSDLEPITNPVDIKIGDTLAAVYPSDKPGEVEYYRAKVIFIERKKDSKASFEVRFIDFGNTRMCSLDELRRLRGVGAVRFLTEPPYCFPCALSSIQPSMINCPDGIWNLESKQLFVNKTDGEEVDADISSVVNGIVRVILYVKGEKGSVNKYLIDQRVADHYEENYMSKYDHIEREIGRKEKNSNCLTKETIRHLQEEEVPTIKPPSRGDGNMQTIQIKGPFTPLETTLYGLTKNSSGSPHIERDSVNHVLLENEPNDMSEKYLVAVSANQNDEHSSITVRNTTLMPNIRGFGPLMAAIFAPQIKLLRSEDKTCYIRMITGLGCDKRNVCLSPNTTVTFDLDVELKNIDIVTINGIRSSINCLLSRKGQRYPPEKKIEIMKSLQDDLIGLLSPKRLLIPNEYGTLSWGPYNQDDIDTNLGGNLQHGQREKDQNLPPHQCLRLRNSPPIAEVMDLEKHHKDLRSKRNATNDDPTRRSEKCKLCKVDIDEGIRLHLLSRQHKDRHRAIKEYQSQ